MNSGYHTLLSRAQELTNSHSAGISHGRASNIRISAHEPFATPFTSNPGCLLQKTKGRLGLSNELVRIQIDHAESIRRKAAQETNPHFPGEEGAKIGRFPHGSGDRCPTFRQRALFSRLKRDYRGVFRKKGFDLSQCMLGTVEIRGRCVVHARRMMCPLDFRAKPICCLSTTARFTGPG